jgi:hypothetical protein
MPAKHPRLTITLRPELHARLRRLSELTQNSQSALVSQLLDGAEETLDRVIGLLEAASQATDDLRGRLAKDMHTAQVRIEQQLGLALEDVSAVASLVQESLDTPPGVDGGVAAAAPGGGSTPLSNRGVRSLTTTVQNHSSRPSRGVKP